MGNTTAHVAGISKDITDVGKTLDITSQIIGCTYGCEISNDGMKKLMSHIEMRYRPRRAKPDYNPISNTTVIQCCDNDINISGNNTEGLILQLEQTCNQSTVVDNGASDNDDNGASGNDDGGVIVNNTDDHAVSTSATSNDTGDADVKKGAIILSTVIAILICILILIWLNA